MVKEKKPIVYSCSACSNLAQIAHDLALNMDRDGIAEMSCTSGVTGKVEPILALARSGRPIIAIDGCALGCTKACLEACEIKIDLHFNLSEYGFEKRPKEQSALSESCIALTRVYQELARQGFALKPGR